MIRTILFLLLVLTMAGDLCGQRNETMVDPVDLVDVFIDTHASRFDYFISASLPFGMIT
ncbi:MAG: hypothetical protein HQ522_01140, partial [Bacteroidetes bacterium]|nr:hypothetical protein [Bacteroidota bacterium]